MCAARAPQVPRRRVPLTKTGGGSIGEHARQGHDGLWCSITRWRWVRPDCHVFSSGERHAANAHAQVRHAGSGPRHLTACVTMPLQSFFSPTWSSMSPRYRTRAYGNLVFSCKPSINVNSNSIMHSISARHKLSSEMSCSAMDIGRGQSSFRVVVHSPPDWRSTDGVSDAGPRMRISTARTQCVTQ